MSRQLEIYEVEYSCSPGGIDKWEIAEVGGDTLEAILITLKRRSLMLLWSLKGKN